MFFYRYIDIRTTNGVTLSLHEYRLVRETPCGLWIRPTYVGNEDTTLYDKWMRKDAFRRFAHNNKLDAIMGFIMRKRRQISIVSTQLDNARLALHHGKVAKSNLRAGVG